jgi:CHAT domain-containing protein
MLVVAMPHTPALADLPGAEAEANLVTGWFPGRYTRLTGQEATSGRVTADMTTHTFAHFACHGSPSLDRPSSSALMLADGRLTVLEVAQLDLSQAEMAFLSACSTATGGQRLPDEAIHLASALQFAGYPHVIATLWSVLDPVAKRVARDVYLELAAPPGGLDLAGAAVALHKSLRRLRGALPDPAPELWAPFIHVGR